ncbi:hypothetical protein [Sphaerimonospora thailandensis]|uniref:Gram-positive cocci surface proteins LPxTG domain-containing protein n=1 Tax=Sphaerimonospora thailandensis TaxID=795644 RepID=A0A8J3W0B4_9ACTN|nr:hypothetical protein [Sphaerimonospora thailandensis]GIH71417.1 hypothetical protein Mth01_36700 [Sphaerimonospora thailandensis]
MTRKHAGPILLALTAAGGLALGTSAVAVAAPCPPPKATARENASLTPPVLAASLAIFIPRHGPAVCGPSHIERVWPVSPGCRGNRLKRADHVCLDKPRCGEADEGGHAHHCRNDAGDRAACNQRATPCGDRRATATSGVSEEAPAGPADEAGQVGPGDANTRAPADDGVGEDEEVPEYGWAREDEEVPEYGGAREEDGASLRGGCGQPVPVPCPRRPGRGTAPEDPAVALSVVVPGVGTGDRNGPGRPGRPGQPERSGRPGQTGKGNAPGGPAQPGGRPDPRDASGPVVNPPGETATPQGGFTPAGKTPRDIAPPHIPVLRDGVPSGHIPGGLPFTGAPAGIALAGAGLLAAGAGAALVSVRRRRSAGAK